MLPSVTQVLGVYADFSKIRPDVLAHAATRGSEVHRICGAIALGAWVPSIPDECAGYVESFRAWLPYVTKFVVIEQRMRDETAGYHGQPDIICTMRGSDALVLCDLKTPAAKNSLWRVQLAAYWALSRTNGYAVERTFSLRLRRDGGFPILNEYQRQDRDYAVFLAALTAYRNLKE